MSDFCVDFWKGSRRKERHFKKSSFFKLAGSVDKLRLHLNFQDFDPIRTPKVFPVLQLLQRCVFFLHIFWQKKSSFGRFSGATSQRKSGYFRPFFILIYLQWYNLNLISRIMTKHRELAITLTPSMLAKVAALRQGPFHTNFLQLLPLSASAMAERASEQT